MLSLIQELDIALRNGRPVCYTALVETRGSTPQKAGATMLVFADGSQVGTLGGGCVEAEVKRRALTLLAGGSIELLSFQLDNDYGWDDGLICGGRMKMLVDPLRPGDDVSYYRALQDMLTAGRGATEAVVIDSEKAGAHDADRWLLDEQGDVVAERLVSSSRRAATGIPSPPSSGERARVRGPDGDYGSPLKSEEPLTLSPQSRGEGTGVVSGHQPSTVNHQPSYVPDNEPPLLRIDNLKVYYPIKHGLLRRTVGHVKAVDGISFNVYKGQTLGLVGESGCGKTTTGRAILRLLPITGGNVTFEGLDWSHLRGVELRRERRRMQIVFQDPYSSLNPRMTVEAMLTEAMSVHRLGTSSRDRCDRAASLLDEVGLLAAHLHRYPHEFSGGQRQRLCIARSLAVEPDFLICDESVSALDVSVQAQVLNLLKDLQEKRGLTYIFISHDLSVVKFMSDMMGVMYAGIIVEFGPSDAI